MHEFDRILITGGSGFLGMHLVRFFSQKGFRIRATFNTRKPNDTTTGQVEWAKVDYISSSQAWNNLIKDVDCVIHLIGRAHVFKESGQRDLRKFREINVYPTQALAESCLHSRKIKRFVFISSVSTVCSSSTQPINELSPCRPETGYGMSKLEAENLLKETLQDKISWCILRPAMIYGPEDPGNMRRLIELVRMGLPLPLANVHNARSFLYIGNLLEIMAKVLDHDNAKFKTYLVSDDESISTPELIRMIAKMLNKKVLIFPFPVVILRLMGKFGSLLEKKMNISIGINAYSVDRLIGSLVVDNSSIKHDLDLQMPYSFYDGIKQTLSNWRLKAI